MERELYMHELDLGRPLSDTEINYRLKQDADSEVLEAVLQWMRNEAARYEVDSHDLRAGGKSESATLAQGAAQGLKTLLFALAAVRANGLSEPAAHEADDQ